jgi:geranylgeranyl diphosphate synthase type I
MAALPPPPTPAAALFALRSAVEDTLTGYLGAARGRMAALAPSSAALVDLVAETVATGGKRLRPLLCWCAYRAGGGPEGPEILRAAASLELLHTFAILHDDVMDQAVLRRGRTALHRRLADERRAAGGGADAGTFGISVAVLAGDLALVLSDAMFASCGLPPAALARAEPALESMRIQAIAGQYLDLFEAGALPPAGAAPGAEARTPVLIAHLKTAGYSVEGPLAVGVALAGAAGPVAGALTEYGRAVGEAFFRADELLGLFGDPAETGKDAESDLRRGKLTTLIADALARGGEAEQAAIRSRWGDPQATAGDLAAVRRAVASSGALAAARAALDAQVDRAVRALAGAGLLAPDPGAPPAPGDLLAELAARLRPPA